MVRHAIAPGDDRLAAYRDVGDHAALERAGLFVAEGRLVVERLLEDGRFRVHSVLVTPTAAEALERTFEKRPDVNVVVCDPSILEAVTGFHFHRGCLALAHRPHPLFPLDALSRSTRILAVEGVGNPDNVGGLFRSALALGADGILLDGAAGDPLYRKAIRTSMGATLRLPYSRVADFPATLRSLRARGFQVVALTLGTDAVPLEEARFAESGRIVFVVGSEGPGLTADAVACADLEVRIPVDSRADSLNVVVAASIAMHSAFRVRHSALHETR
jgi:tRNA G18 (ribose-2'-O)-methylase SpoU